MEIGENTNRKLGARRQPHFVGKVLKTVEMELVGGGAVDLLTVADFCEREKGKKRMNSPGLETAKARTSLRRPDAQALVQPQPSFPHSVLLAASGGDGGGASL
jgi:hypothetical protein